MHVAADSSSAFRWRMQPIQLSLWLCDWDQSLVYLQAGKVMPSPHLVVINIGNHQCNMCYLTAVCSRLSTSCCLSSKIRTLPQRQKLRARNERMRASCSGLSSASAMTSMYHHFASYDSPHSLSHFMLRRQSLCLADCWRLQIGFNCYSFLR